MKIVTLSGHFHLPPTGFVPGSAWFNSLASLTQGQLVCFLPVCIYNLLSAFELFGCFEIIFAE